MPMCDACQAIVPNKRHVKAHDALQKVAGGSSYKPFGQAKVYVTNYDCQACGTKWQYEDDKNDPGAGWSVRD